MYNHQKFNVITIQSYDQGLTRSLVAIANGLARSKGSLGKDDPGSRVLFIAINSNMVSWIKGHFQLDKNVILTFDAPEAVYTQTRGISIDHVIMDDIKSYPESYIQMLYARLRGEVNHMGENKVNIYIAHKPLRMAYIPKDGKDAYQG